MRLQGLDGVVFLRGPLQVIVTCDDYESFAPESGVWGHASVSRRTRDPTWEELKEVRDLVFGRESPVIQLLAPASHWLNVHTHCYHLLMRVDAETVPRALWDQVGADGATYGKPERLR